MRYGAETTSQGFPAHAGRLHARLVGGDRQTTALQRDALLGAGVDDRRLHEDRASGARDDRPGLARALEFVRRGDCLVVWKLDRLGRSLPHLLWNTLYMDAALTKLRAEGHGVRDEDVARLSPLGFEHVNMLGRYAFALAEPVARGELRPLRNPLSADGPD